MSLIRFDIEHLIAARRVHLAQKSKALLIAVGDESFERVQVQTSQLWPSQLCSMSTFKPS